MPSASPGVDSPMNVEDRIEALSTEHRQLDAQIKALDSQVWLSPEEQLQRKRFQKLKLATKDQIHQLRRKLQV